MIEVPPTSATALQHPRHGHDEIRDLRRRAIDLRTPVDTVAALSQNSNYSSNNNERTPTA
jgi:hypothetical protein